MHDSDKPFGRIILVPSDGVAIVHRELVVEIVIALANCHEGCNDMVARSVFIIKRGFAQPVREGVDAERAL